MEGYEMCTHPNLRDLDIMIASEQPPLDWDFAAKSPLLERLSLLNVVIGSSCLQGLPYLRKLDMKSVMIRHAPGFWEACKNLEILFMDHVQFEGGFVSIPADRVFARLRSLRMSVRVDVSASEQPALIPHCPNLETFEWDPYTLRVRISIDHPIDKDRCPLLDNQSIPRNPSDAEWASVFERFGNCLGKFTLLDLQNGTFGPRAFKALRSHLNSLVDLRFYGTSSTVRDVLCTCPMLETLHASDILAKDVVEGGSWVCQQLRNLKICFRVKKSEQDLQPLVFERLSALVRLATLDMGLPDDGNVGGSLQFRLDCGLRQLENLKELRIVEFAAPYDTELKQCLGWNDIEWMIDNWKSLHRIYGSLHRNRKIEALLGHLLENRGISHMTPADGGSSSSLDDSGTEDSESDVSFFGFSEEDHFI
jgi:hypothetical protein